jgi:hypothetical protein
MPIDCGFDEIRRKESQRDRKRLATAPDIPTVDEASMSARLIILLVGARYRRKSRISVSKNNED